MFDVVASGATAEPAVEQARAFAWTPQQEAYFAAVREQDDPLAVNAVAGSSKTTSSVEAAKGALERGGVGMTAFNKVIADELQRRLPAGASAATMHSVGFRLLRERFDGIEVDDKKLRRLFLDRFPEMHRAGTKEWAGRHFPKREYESVPEIVRCCKMQLLDEARSGRAAIVTACEGMDVELPDDDGDLEECLDAAGELLGAAAEDTTACDFDDMVWMPVRLDLVRPQFDTLFVDEAQDLSPVQHELVCRSGERLIVVGDPKQAIYGFAGADSSSFDTLRDRLSAVELPLSVSFRCP